MKKNSFMEGTVIATFVIVLVKILGMLYVIPFYKIVGSQGGALYSYAYNIYLVFLGISSAGLPSAVSKIISEYNALDYNDAKVRVYKIARNIISFISVITFAVLFIFAEEIGHLIIGNMTGGNTVEDVAFVIRCISPSVLVVAFLSITRGYLQGHKYVSSSSISQLIEQIIRVAVILIGSYLILKVFNGTLNLAIGISLLGAFFGGVAAYIYLKCKIRKSEIDINKLDITKKDDISNEEIIKKIIKYAVPFIIINIVTNLYGFTDQILVLRTIENMGYNTADIEFIASSISTYAPKICMIVNAMSMGLTISIIPTIVSAITKKDMNEVNDKINKSISMVFFISLPLTLGLIILSDNVWSIFYGPSAYGSMILKYSLISALLANVYMVLSTIAQSLNKYKLVYSISIIGFSLNALLDIPLMYLVHNLGYEGFIGSIFASIIGFSTSIIIGMVSLKKLYKVNYKNTFSIVVRSLLVGLLMVISLIPFMTIINISNNYLNIIVNTIIGGLVFVYFAYKTNLLKDVFGEEYLNRIIKKLTPFKGK